MTVPPPCTIGNVEFGTGQLALIAGPCLAESLDLCREVAAPLAEFCGTLGIGYVFKASFDKANRSSPAGDRGPGLEQGLAWLATIKEEFGLPVLTDIHLPDQAAVAAEVVDALQIPAFLCRQTDLLVAAGRTGKAVNIKKGQFMAPWDMQNAVRKVRAMDNDNVLLTERGTSFGYNTLVSDMRAIPQMRAFAPVVFDGTHSVQQPGGLGSASGGQREFVATLAQAALAAGADALFLEVHPDPANALSDAACQLPLAGIETLLKRCRALFRAVR
jgi:2-dehydro-3-deoxyphosphooctonate aldolase (KDO 8-P synthase)